MEKKPNLAVKKKNTPPLSVSSLIDLVFSWSVQDVLNNDLYIDKVNEIPTTFTSTSLYLNSFTAPLIEETRADLFSSITTLPQAPACEILYIEEAKCFKLPDALFYKISLNKWKVGNAVTYKAGVGDLFVLTDVMPKCIDDLERPGGMPYLIALVDDVGVRNPFKITIRSSMPIDLGHEEEANKKGKLYALFLTNMITNIRIWRALNIGPTVGNFNIIKKVLQTDLQETCKHSLPDKNCIDVLRAKTVIRPFNLNDSQEAAILSCVSTRNCYQHSHLKLIWGPPGTGKTKTVGSLLFVLLGMKCRTLTCAPTNIAVIEVTSRLLKSFTESVDFNMFGVGEIVQWFMESHEYDTYGLGDIVLFGNKERMKIVDHDDLLDVFLDYRADMLAKCFAPFSGWRHCLQSMINLLEDPAEMYHTYLETLKQEEEKEKEGDKKQKGKTDKKCSDSLTFEEFMMNRFNSTREQLIFCMKTSCTHLPTSCISSAVVKEMIRANSLLKSLASLLRGVKVTDEGFKKYIRSSKLSKTRNECLQVLRSLSSSFTVPELFNKLPTKYAIMKFCMKKAYLLFCTASSSAKLNTQGMVPLEFLVIDEAAQLKECESAIPLQLTGLRHAVLIGDERQLPAMVKSEICEKAGFGRSLFERLVLLGHEKHLLNIQYRMHPSISVFPKREFYDDQILDAPNVKEQNYEQHFLRGKMYGSYSFINVRYGREDFDLKHSRKNMVEVAVVADLIERLFRESVATKQKVSVGVISPYTAQVVAIRDKLGSKYSNRTDSDFSLSVRSVDGYQGGEDDVIILSTVRCNGSGSIGFLSNRNRANVALTRARYCLWVLGSGATLLNSGSVWNKLVTDAKNRDCFYDADDDKSLVQAIIINFLELNQVDNLHDVGSKLFVGAWWKVSFSNDFWRSMVKMNSGETQSKVLSLLQKLSAGWRKPCKWTNSYDLNGASSQMLKVYNVNGFYNLVWTVDILEENSSHLQVLKIWDVLPLSQILIVAKQLDSIFRHYSAHIIDRCNFKCVKENLEVPMRWQEDSRDVQFLSSQLASLRLRNEPDTLALEYRKQWKSKLRR